MRDLTYPELDRLNYQAHCPFCGGTQIIEGPSGGASVNISCANENCGAGFNISPIMKVFGQLIKEPKGGVPDKLWGEDTMTFVRNGSEIRALPKKTAMLPEMSSMLPVSKSGWSHFGRGAAFGFLLALAIVLLIGAL